MSFAQLITRMTRSAVAGDGSGVAACFTPDGVYHDVYYGAFRGPEIAGMIENHFHRDARNFRWDIHDPVEADGLGYARYVFSYESRLAGAEGRRGLFEGIVCCRLRDGLIADYSEVANAAVGLHELGFPPDRLAKFVAKQADELKARAETAAHLA